MEIREFQYILESSHFEPAKLARQIGEAPAEKREELLITLLENYRRKSTLLSLSDELSNQLELGPLIQAIVFKITEILNADRSSLFLIDRETGELWSKVAQGIEFSEIRFPKDVGLAGYVATTGKFLNIPDVYEHHLFNPSIDKKTGYRTKTMLCMPIQNRLLEIIGVVQVINKKNNETFVQRDEEVLLALTRILALTLENALLYEKVRSSQRKIEALLGVANSLASSLDILALIQTIMSKACELMNADRASLFLIDREKKELWSKVAQGTDVNEIRFPMHLGIAGHVATTGETLNIPDAYDHPLFNRAIDKKIGYRTRTILCMPIRSMTGEVIGVTQVINRKAGVFERADIDLLGAFSAQAAVAIENAQLYAKTLEMKNHLESILKCLSNGVMTLNYEGLVTLINPSGERIMGCSAEQIQGLHVSNLLGDKNQAFSQKILKVVETGEQSSDYDVDFIQGSGQGAEKNISLNYTLAPLNNNAGQRQGVVAVLEDITKEKRIKSNLNRYMSKDLVDKVMSERDNIVLGGKRIEVTILFSDIRSYTSLTERSDAGEVVAMLNDYFTHMVDAVFKFGGVLDKFIGDAIMAVFGAPLPLVDHAFRSVQAALEMRLELARFNQKRIAENKEAISIGIGISTGEVLCGNIGSEKRMEYTAIGDGVNLSARLESATKYYRAMIMLSEFTRMQVGDKAIFRELDYIRVKGKARPVRIYELLDERWENIDDPSKRLFETYERGRVAFNVRQFVDAEKLFQNAIQILPDHPSEIYIGRCRHFIANPPGDAWDGVFEMTSK